MSIEEPSFIWLSRQENSVCIHVYSIDAIMVSKQKLCNTLGLFTDDGCTIQTHWACSTTVILLRSSVTAYSVTKYMYAQLRTVHEALSKRGVVLHPVGQESNTLQRKECNGMPYVFFFGLTLLVLIDVGVCWKHPWKALIDLSFLIAITLFDYNLNPFL